MRVTSKITIEAETASHRYGILVESWRSIYQKALSSSDFGTQRQIERVVREAYQIANTFIASETAQVQGSFDDIALEAYQTTLKELQSKTVSNVTDEIQTHLSDAGEYLEREIRIQIERDIAFLQQSLRKAYLQVSLSSRSQRISAQSALLQYRIGNAVELHFFFHDRSNQKWPSRKFIRSVWRQSLLSVYNEAVLLTLADHGIDKAEVKHSSADSASHGMIIAMHPGSSLPTYSEIRAEVFHPNSDAILARVTEDVHS